MICFGDQISKIRYGFSTNSSSSHSIIYYDGKENIRFRAQPNQNKFGWDWFLQSTPRDKNNYFRTYTYEYYITQGLSLEDSRVLAEYNFPCDDSGLEIDTECKRYESGSNYIDHQSFRSYPKPQIDSQSLNDLFRWIKKNIVSNPKVYILGGNDNGEGDSPLDDLQDEIKLHEISDRIFCSDSRFKIDPQGFLTIFNASVHSPWPRLVRTKINNQEDPIFGFYPDLIDIKITDFCDRGCRYCYQNSTKEGLHSTLAIYSYFAYQLQKLGVFEVALGGGEPTSHPDFDKILQYFHKNQICPSFSTQSMKWLENDKILEAVKKYCGAVAFSTNDVKTARKWLTLAQNQIGLNYPVIHYVLGITPIEELNKFIETLVKEDLDPNIILLAYKNVGRGANFKSYDYSNWTNIIRNLKQKYQYRFTIGIDSFLVDDVKKSMPEIKECLYDVSDGHFSFYYDAVQNKYAKHSADPSLLFYSDEKRPDLFDPKLAWNKIIKEFRKPKKLNRV